MIARYQGMYLVRFGLCHWHLHVHLGDAINLGQEVHQKLGWQAMCTLRRGWAEEYGSSMHAEMSKWRLMQLSLSSQINCHIQMLRLLSTRGENDLSHAAAAYILSHVALVICKKQLTNALRPLGVILYLLHLVKTLTCADMTHYLEMQAFNSALTCCYAAIFMDAYLSIPMGICVSLADAVMFEVLGGEFTRSALWTRLLILVVYVMIPACAEETARRLIQTSQDATRMLASFRRIIKGSSDGDLLLDSDFKILDEAKCLQHLTGDLGRSFEGASFLSMLSGPGATRDFVQFADHSDDELAQSGSAPACHRIHLFNAFGVPVGVDVCHVRVPNLFGATKPYHLLVFKEDPEPREGPSAERNPAAGSIASSVEPQTAASQAECSESSLASITLLLDGMSEHFDILEAHIKFKHQTEDTSDTFHCVPNLQGLTRPQDWEDIYQQLSQFIWGCYSVRTTPEPIPMHPMLLRLGPSYVHATEAQLSLASELFGPSRTHPLRPLRLSLCLSGFGGKEFQELHGPVSVAFDRVQDSGSSREPSPFPGSSCSSENV